MTTAFSQPTQSLALALQTAHQWYAQGNLVQAELVCRQILSSLPKQPDAVHLLGIIALKDGNIEKAVQHLQRAVKLQPAHPLFHANLGLALHEQGQLAQAEACYRQALRLNPQYADAYYNLHALLIKSDYLPALDCLKQVVRLTPNDAEARLMLAVLLTYQGNREEAQVLLEKLQGLGPLMDARLDAWEYFQSLPALPPLSGSNIETFKRAVTAAKVKGMVLEFGVRHGNSIRQLVQLAQQDVHGFDSFEGLPEAWHDESQGSYSTKGVIPKVPPRVKLHAGWFENTLPAFLEKQAGPIRLINVDCDIYSSTRTVLTLLAPHIVPGTVIIFDEYIGNAHWREDEFKAFQEAVQANGWRYEYLGVSFFTKQVIVRIM